MIFRSHRILGLILSAVLLAASGLFARDALQDGQKQFEQGHFAAAAKTLEEALASKSQDASLHYWLGRTYYELRDVDRALEHTERAAQLDAQNSDYHLWYGHACGRKARQGSSLRLAHRTKKEFEEAVRLNPSNISARRALVDYLSSAPWIAGGSDGDARREADAIAALDAVEGRLAWADYWGNNEKPEQAVAEFEKDLEMKPRRIEPYMEALRFFAQREDAPRLQKTLEVAEQVNSADPRLLFFRGALRTFDGTRAAEAEQFLPNYISSVTPRTGYPSHNVARLWLGRLYEKQQRCREAVQQYREVLVADPKNERALAGYKRATQKCN